MNAIQEEDNLSPEVAFQTPKLNDSDASSFSLSNMNAVGNVDGIPSQNRTFLHHLGPVPYFILPRKVTIPVLVSSTILRSLLVKTLLVILISMKLL